MNDVTKSKYNFYLKEPGRGNNQKAHQLRRSAFSAFVFQIIGNKHVVLAAIQYPISSAAQPEYAVKRFMSAWQQEKLSEDYNWACRLVESGFFLVRVESSTVINASYRVVTLQFRFLYREKCVILINKFLRDQNMSSHFI